MGRYCVDASVVLARLFNEDYPQVETFWTDLTVDDELFGAQLLRPECMAVVRKNVANGNILLEQGRRMIDELIALPITISNSLRQFQRAFEFAETFQLQKGYDIQYLAVAELEGGQLVTIDGGMRQHAVQLRVPCLFLR